MLKKIILTFSIILTLTIFSGCFNEDANDMLSSNEHVLSSLSGKQIVVKQDGKGFYLDGDKNKLVIFDIFATWCPPCQASASHLSSLQDKYKDEILIIGVTIEKPERTKEGAIINEKLNKFRIKYNAKYTMVNSEANSRLSDVITKSLEMGPRYPIPLMAMYKDGKYINHYVGAVQEEFVESDIKRALNK